MDRIAEIKDIINRDISEKMKISLLQDRLIDLKNEMEAQDQNMHPELRKGLSEAYQLANQYLLNAQDDI